MPKLEEWYVFYRYSNTYQEKMPYLSGRVFNDTRFPDGSVIYTSAVLEIRQGFAKTKNTEYILG